MNRKHFEEILEKKFKEARQEFEVLRLVLKGLDNSEIAKFRGRGEGTVRKQISNIYKKFGIKSESSEDQNQRDKLIDLFLQYKSEWVSNDSAICKNENINPLDNINNNSPISSVPKAKEDLMPFAITILDQIGFNEIFKITKSSNCVGYRPKNPQTVDKRYQLFLENDSFGLTISINKEILEPYLLNFKYWTVINYSLDEETAARLLIIPGREKLFFDSLEPKYWNILEVEQKTVGDVYLNDQNHPEYYDHIKEEITKNCLEGFDEYMISSTYESYLIISEHQKFNFNYTRQMFITSKEVLKDFLVYFGKVLMEKELSNTPDPDDIPF